MNADLLMTPAVVEIVNSREKLEAFLAGIDSAIHEGLATMEKAKCVWTGAQVIALIRQFSQNFNLLFIVAGY